METLTLPRLLGRAWGVASFLLGVVAMALAVGLVSVVLIVAGRGVVAAFNAHEARPASAASSATDFCKLPNSHWLCSPSKPHTAATYAPAPPPAPRFVAPQPQYVPSPPAYAYAYAPPPMPPMTPPMMPPMMPPRFVFIRPGFGHAFGGFAHFGGRHR